MKLYAFLSCVSLFFVSFIAPFSAWAEDRPAEKGAVGATIHFTLEANESQDIAISLPKGDYVIQSDLKLVKEDYTNIQMSVDLLKTNGVMVQDHVLSANEVHRVTRVAKSFHLAKPLGARLRVKCDSEPMEFWVTVFPATKRTFIPYAFASDTIKPLGIGENQGTGGTLAKRPEDGFYVFHKIALPAGKYDISLYMKQVDKTKTNLQGSIRQLDKFGVPLSDNWELNVNEIDIEVRKDKRLVLLKPTTIYFLVTNDNSSNPCEYTVGIDKATE